jgi:hypothetical protein
VARLHAVSLCGVLKARHPGLSYFMALNLKRLVKLLTGVSFKAEARGLPIKG